MVQPRSIIVVYPIGSLLRKVILYQKNNLDSPSCYVVVNLERPQIPLKQSNVIILAYPLAGDMVLVQGDNDELWHAYVISVDHGNKYCQVG